MSEAGKTEPTTANVVPSQVELRDEGTHVIYSTGSGGQQLVYQEPVRAPGQDQQKLTFSGEEIASVDVGIGRMVSLVLERASHGTYTLGLLLPNFYPNRHRSEEPEDCHVDTLAILTQVEGGIVPPHLKSGQVESYYVLQLQGTARLVESWRVPTELFKSWVHSHEEDTGDVEVYRPRGFDFPPSWPRPGFEIKENGEFVEYVPADNVRGVVPSPEGRWEVEGENKIGVYFSGPEPERYTLDIVSVDENMLRIRR